MRIFDNDLGSLMGPGSPFRLSKFGYVRVIILLLLCLAFLLPVAVSRVQAAAYATGGTGKYVNDILWLTWGGGVNGTANRELTVGSLSEADIALPNGKNVTLTCRIASIAHEAGGDERLVSYRPGDWSGDKCER